MGEHGLHVGQKRTICTEVVIDGLIVADTYHDAVEYRKLGSFGCRDEHAPLEHILQKTHGLQTYRLTSGVRTGNQQDVLARRQTRCERYDFLLLLAQGPFKQGMTCLAEVEFAFF